VRGLGFAEIVDSDVGVLEVTCAPPPTGPWSPARIPLSRPQSPQ